MSVLNTQQIQEILPHRYPMLMLDTVEELVLAKALLRLKTSQSMKKFSRDIFQVTQRFQVI